MVHFCCVPGCSNNSSREAHLSFFSLPLKRKKVLKQWVHVIGRKNLSINKHTRVCSEHFVQANGRLLRKDEAPSARVPCGSEPKKKRKPPKDRSSIINDEEETESGRDEDEAYSTQDACVQTEKMVSDEQRALLNKVESLQSVLKEKDQQLTKLKFRLMNIRDDGTQIMFYTGFQSYQAIEAFYHFLGPAAECLCYSSDKTVSSKKKRRDRSLSPIEELFMTLIRLRVGLMEQDLAYRFGVSQSTVSRIIITWINFLYLELKKIPLWPPKEIIQVNMPKAFKEKYQRTRVIIDATEVYIDQPRLPDIQQMTFSNYKNSNTFKGLIGISPDGVITFISSLYPGSISDKELTRQSGILDLLESGDSVMADRGFDIEDELILRGVHLNIPPFLRNKKQFSEKELVGTRRIASLRIHVERAMERIKNYHIFDRSLPVQLTDIADRLFFVCCVLTNFQEPLCT